MVHGIDYTSVSPVCCVLLHNGLVRVVHIDYTVLFSCFNYAIQTVCYSSSPYLRCSSSRYPPFCAKGNTWLQVRALASPTDDLILSASRDTTAISWQRSPTTSAFALSSILKAGSRYINSVAYLPPSPEAPKGSLMTLSLVQESIAHISQGYAVTGGQDTVINVFALESPKEDPDFSLVGHTANVCALDVTISGGIVSGSWDG